jgi:hypothetical protein
MSSVPNQIHDDIALERLKKIIVNSVGVSTNFSKTHLSVLHCNSARFYYFLEMIEFIVKILKVLQGHLHSHEERACL